MEQITKKHMVKRSEICFFIFFVSLLFAKGIGLYDGQTAFKVFLVIALMGWAGKAVLTSYSLREIVFYGTFLLLGGVVYVVSHEKGALFVALLLCGMKNIDLKRLFQVGLATWALSFGSLFFF